MIIKTPADIGALIKDARLKAGLSQTALANMLKTTQGWVSEVENGKPTAQINMVLRALNALGIRLDARLTVPHSDRPAMPSSTRPTRPGIADVLQRTKKGTLA